MLLIFGLEIKEPSSSSSEEEQLPVDLLDKLGLAEVSASACITLIFLEFLPSKSVLRLSQRRRVRSGMDCFLRFSYIKSV